MYSQSTIEPLIEPATATATYIDGVLDLADSRNLSNLTEYETPGTLNKPYGSLDVFLTRPDLLQSSRIKSTPSVIKTTIFDKTDIYGSINSIIEPIENQPNPKFIEFKNQISLYKNYRSDWDGYGGTSATQKTIDDAFALLKLVKDCLPRNIGLSGDGEISFFWKKGEFFADFGVCGDGTYCYFIKDPSMNIKLYGDEKDLSLPLSHELLTLLSGAQ